MKAKKSYHVSHILVSHEYEAQDVLKKIGEGKSFEEMATKYSKCSSSKNGGDLGSIPFGAAEERFEEAVEDLKPGEMTKTPVRTKFGYHLILRKS